MIGWLIFLGCIAIYAYGFKFFHGLAFRNHFIKWEKEHELNRQKYPSLYRKTPSLAEYEKEKGYANVDAVMLGIIWPLSWVYFLGRHFVTASAEPNTPQYLRVKQEQELKELRKLAREHGLALPEELDN